MLGHFYAPFFPSFFCWPAPAWSGLLCHWRPLSTPDYVCFCCDRRDITNCHHKLNATSRLCRHRQPGSQPGVRMGVASRRRCVLASPLHLCVCVCWLWHQHEYHLQHKHFSTGRHQIGYQQSNTCLSFSVGVSAAVESEAVANPTGRPPQAIFSLSSGAFK